MKVLLQLIALTLVMVIIPVQANAQIKGIIGTADFDEDNAIVGESTTITIVSKFVSSVTNNDTMVTGNVFFRYKTNWSIDWNDDWSATIDDTVTTAQTVNPGYNIYDVILPIPDDTNIFRTGPPINVIIIWPAFYNPSIDYTDSADYIIPNQQIFVGLEEEPVQKFGSTAFPNPAGSMQLVFVNSKYSQDISSISIMNSLGQMMSIKEFTESEDSKGYILPTEDLKAGIYHIHILYKDRKREVVKFIKN